MARERARALLFADTSFSFFCGFDFGEDPSRLVSCWWIVEDVWGSKVGGVEDEVGCGGLGRGG